MRLVVQVLVTLGVLGAAGAAWYFWYDSQLGRSQAPSFSPNRPPRAEAPKTIQYPIPLETGNPPEQREITALSKPVPTSVDASDPPLLETLEELFGKSRLEAMFVTKDIVRRIVSTVDMATARLQPSAEVSAVKPLTSPFRFSRQAGKLTLAPENYPRYKPYVALLGRVEPRRLVVVYRHFYPLFQSAYQDLGTPGYFNDRLVQVLDHLLNTPEPIGPVALFQPGPRSSFRYADMQLEGLTAGQKALIRTGSANERAIKAYLRQIRALIVNSPTQTPNGRIKAPPAASG